MTTRSSHCSSSSRVRAPQLRMAAHCHSSPTVTNVAHHVAPAIQQGLPQGPSVAPYAYSSSDHSGSTGAFIAVIQNGQLVQQGSVLTTDDSASGAISTFSGSEQQAPASGIPSP